MKKLILFIVFIISLGCSTNKEPIDDGLPYFQFVRGDNDKFIDGYAKDGLVTYVNQFNEEIKFKVLISRISKQLEDRGSWIGSSTKFFYYDEQRIEMGGLSEVAIPYNQDDKFYISIKRWPITFKDGSEGEPVVISPLSRVITNIGLIPFNTGVQSLFLDYSQTIQNLTINGTTYTKVRKLALPLNPYPNLNWTPQSLTFLYFDQNNGVIGFDDIENKEWRLQL